MRREKRRDKCSCEVTWPFFLYKAQHWWFQMLEIPPQGLQPPPTAQCPFSTRIVN